jgi:hypothetical protein
MSRVSSAGVPPQVGPSVQGTSCKGIREAELREASVVSRPANPEARLVGLPIDSQRLVSFLGHGFQIGMPLSCDTCLEECGGFDELPYER